MSNLERLVARSVQAGLSWFGEDCVLCAGRSGAEALCAACVACLPALPERCPQCALPSPGGLGCGTCLADPPHFDATLALWLYEFPCDRLVQALKYRARLALALFFARSLSARPLPAVDLLVPMPLHPNRLALRGFNQAAEIARSLARLRRVAFAPGGARRVRDTAAQTDLPYEERTRNVRGAFACDRDLSGKRVAVVDDVMTTGATLNELAGVLKRAGAARVENWVVARSVLR
jgi:ComF family protein